MQSILVSFSLHVVGKNEVQLWRSTNIKYAFAYPTGAKQWVVDLFSLTHSYPEFVSKLIRECILMVLFANLTLFIMHEPLMIHCHCNHCRSLFLVRRVQQEIFDGMPCFIEEAYLYT